MILGLGGNDRLLHPCQKLLRLRQRQPQIRDLAKVVGPADLQHLHTPCPAVGPRFHQLQPPPHPRSPSRQRPDRSYRFRPYPPSLWTLPSLLSGPDHKCLRWIVAQHRPALETARVKIAHEVEQPLSVAVIATRPAIPV